jgi:hypothetical protein
MFGRGPGQWLLVMLATVLIASACSGTTATLGPDAAESPDRDPGVADEGTTDDAGNASPAPAVPDQEPVPFRPAGPVGTADGYNALIAELEAELPSEIRAQVPWPDLRNPDPAQVQVEIFDLWIWVIENHPDPLFARAMSVAGSPSREETVSVFAEIKADDELHIREGSPYVAFDHRVVTFASAGLPLWLEQNVPEDAVVVYYQDESGPTTIRDRDSGVMTGSYGGPGARQWLSIMVPTDAGWMLFRDQLIEPNDSELEVPQAPPSPEIIDPRIDV